MANWNKLTESKYNAIKTLLKGGASQQEAAEYMQVSGNTVWWINKSEDYKDYIQAQEIRLLQKKRKEAEPEKSVTDDKQKGGTISANYQINRIYELLKTQNETMKLISNKLAFIVDELCWVKTNAEQDH
jgi:hypothetical protein